jgi:FKBP-type peptidyl-prolyl cis-trans isomerase 2
MKNISAFAAVLTLLAAGAFAAVKSYQVTGIVKSVTADTIVVDKNKEMFEISRAGSKVTGDVKVGSKVTVEYRMTATTITVKDEKPAAPAKKK